MQVEDILDHLPTTPQERSDVIISLLEMIDHWNAGITRHQSYPEPDQATIVEFTDMRNTYIGQLAVVMNYYGVTIQLPTPPANTGRLAA